MYHIHFQRSYSVVVAAAGYSDRMGVPKLFLPFDKAENFLQHISNVYITCGARTVLVVVNARDYGKVVPDQYVKQVQFIVNKEVEKGRFHSILLGVSRLKEENALFVHNIDNPFIDGEIINGLLNRIDRHDYCVPTYRQQAGHPVLLNRKLIVALASEGNNGPHHFKTFLKRFRRGAVAVNHPGILANINTPEIYAKYGFNSNR